MTNSFAKPADFEQRQTALDGNRSFIVQAPAGSGKTTLLISRYLVLLAQAQQPEEILAITFTRKATAEMKDRIHVLLQHGVHNPDAISDPQVRTLVLDVIERDKNMHWQLWRNSERLKIMTIDSFCAQLVRKMPLTSGLGGMPAITETEKQLYELAAQHTISHIENDNEWSEACRLLLRIAKGSWQKAQNLLVDMLSSRDLWMRDVELTDREHVQCIWHTLMQSDIEKAEACIPTHFHQDILTHFNFAREQIAQTHTQLNTPLLELLNVSELTQFPACHVSDLPKWQALSAFLTTENELKWRKQVNVNQGFDSKKHKEQKKQFHEVLAQLAESGYSGHALRELQTLPPIRIDDTTWQTISALYNLLFLCAGELQIIFQQSNQCDFTEIAQRADRALGELQDPSDLALSLDYKIQHVLMDEFQDTSTVQVSFLQKLTQGWSENDGRSIFLVGDPMQSIYSFRGAEVANFLHARDLGIANKKLQALNLTSNFRCHGDLVTWHNARFSKIFPSQSDIQSGAIAYSESSIANLTVDSLSPAVQRHALVHNDCDEAKYIAQLVSELLTRHNDKEIAILGRSRNHLSQIAGELDALQIEHADTEIEKLHECSEINDLLALTRALMQRADRVAWLALLRAPWVGLELKDLHQIANQNSATCIADCLNDEEVLHALSPVARQRIEFFHHAIAPVIENAPWQSLATQVERCWMRLAAPRFLDELQISNAKSFLTMLHNMGKHGNIDLAELMSKLEKLTPAINNTRQVQLMTIHKAKGLQFDIVILPSLHRSGRNQEKNIINSLRLTEHVLVAPILDNPNEPANRFHAYLQKIDKQKNYYELMRLLYVACTRAKSQLHLVASLDFNEDGEVKAPRKNTLLDLLWPTDSSAFCNAIVQSEKIEDSNKTHAFNPLKRVCLPITDAALPPAIITEHIDIIQNQEEIEFSWAGEVARLVGIAVHALLQYIDYMGWPTWQQLDDNYFKQQLDAMNISASLDGQEYQQWQQLVMSAIKNIKNDTTAHWIFSSTHQFRESEWALSGTRNNEVRNIIIDRSFVDEQDVRWIIDFKTSRHDGSDMDNFVAQEKIRYQQQLDNYAQIVSCLDNRPIKLGLYFPLLQKWTHWHWKDTQ